MKISVPATSPDAYVSALEGWQGDIVRELRSSVLASSDVEERIKWGHLVYFSNGPAFLIRAEKRRVLFGFWRGKRMQGIEKRLKPGGKYEMATLELREGSSVRLTTVRRLTRAAVDLNRSLGDPTRVARKGKQKL